MKYLSTLIFTVAALSVFGQIVGPVSNACNIAQNLCNNSPTVFPLSTGVSPSPVVPAAGSISNPNINPAGVNSGCLLAGELNPNWFILNVASTGNLEFQIGAPGGSGYYDWELWPYNPNTTCNNIANGTLAPAACNWNASSAGFTGMSTGGPPAGGIAGNFQPSIPVVAGQAYILMFSNYSSAQGTASLTFPPTGAAISCTPNTPDQIICLGDTAFVDIINPPTSVNPTYNWQVTTGVSNPTGGTNVAVVPTTTTTYIVDIIEPATIGTVTDTFTITVVNPPAPNAGLDTIICQGNQIPLSGILSDPANNTFVWSYDASQVSPIPSVNFNPNNITLNTTATVNQPGIYNFILTETSSVCGNVDDTVQVQIATISLTATSVPPSCQGLSDGQIHITSSEAVQYSYDNGATWVADSFNLAVSAGTYTVCAQSIYGCQACTTINVIDPAPVTIAVSNDTTICQNGTANMWATATGGVSYDFHWDHTGSLNANQSVNPLATTTYTVYAENELGCISPNESIIVTVLPALTGSTSPTDTVCPGYSTDISANVTGGIGTPYTFNWSTGDTYTGAGSHTITVTPSQTTTYTVTITDDCESTPLVMQITVRVAPVPEPDYLVLDPDQCEPAVFTIVNTTDPSMSQYVYWLIDGEHQYINQDTILSPELYEGQYDIQMIVTSYEGCIDSTTWIGALNVMPKPRADFKYSPDPITMFNTGDVAFIDHSYLGYSYEWWFDQGSPATSTVQNPHVAFPDGIVGTYSVTLVTTSELGCTDTITKIITVQPEVIIYAPNAFTPDGDEHNQGWRVYMEGIDPYQFELTIYNRWGEMIWESHDMEVEWDGTYNNKRVETGTYSWIIHTKDRLNDDKHTFNGHVTVLK